jgi:DNA-3-methyladenine glycosylase
MPCQNEANPSLRTIFAWTQAGSVFQFPAEKGKMNLPPSPRHSLTMPLRSAPTRPLPKPLPRDFYSRTPDAVAHDLLGKLLVRTLGRGRLIGRIVEVEAYFGLEDPASHAAPGLTPRNAVLFGRPGIAYVYFIYGMHYCLNVSCEPKGQPGGILFRALEPVAGIPEMARLRNLPATAPPCLLTSGPGRLCQALGITRDSHNGHDLTSRASTLQIVDDGFPTPAISIGPRVGIRKAVDRPARYSIAGHPCVSRPSQIIATTPIANP